MILTIPSVRERPKPSLTGFMSRSIPSHPIPCSRKISCPSPICGWVEGKDQDIVMPKNAKIPSGLWPKRPPSFSTDQRPEAAGLLLRKVFFFAVEIQGMQDLRRGRWSHGYVERQCEVVIATNIFSSPKQAAGVRNCWLIPVTQWDIRRFSRMLWYRLQLGPVRCSRIRPGGI